ncbi:hypothetical protein AURDEDRAFT_160570 [Auricularia subglabra TFB-10046 SS5]|nr:hypothetical protein AURDEDRAFT_160570 [Auricularia subglabra TFB-10046 SS5]
MMSDSSSQVAVDVVLQTPSGTQYRVPSAALARASGFFAALFSSAHPDDTSSATSPNVIAVDEDDSTIAPLLSAVTGQPFRFREELKDMGEIVRITQAADKYDMPTVLAVMELMMYAPVAREHPLRRYALASRHGWDSVRDEVVQELLDVEMDFVDLPPMDMLHLGRLLRLRQTRVSTLATILNNPEGEFGAGNSAKCTTGHDLTHPTLWESLKTAVLWEMSRRPSGSTVPAIFQPYSPEASNCPDCARKDGSTVSLWATNHTCNRILTIIKELPNKLDEC